MPIDNYIRIIIKDTGLSKSEILEMMNARKEDVKGLVSDKAALFMLGRELCVDMSDSSKTSFVKLTKFSDSNSTIKSSKNPTDLKEEESILIERIIVKLKEKHLDNLIAIYGIGSYFDQGLPATWMTDDIDLILIMKSLEKIPNEDWNSRFKTKKFRGKNLFTGFNTIESYNSKVKFNETSGANYEWSLFCLKHAKNSRLLYGTDIRDQLPNILSFDYGDILARGFYHFERSLQAGETLSAKRKYSKGIFKVAFYLCVFFDNSFRYTSLLEIGKKLKQLHEQEKIDAQILEFFEEAMIYRMMRQYKTDFSILRKDMIYFMFSLLEEGKLHKKMGHSELVKYLSIYFGGFPYLLRKAKNISLSKTLS